MNYYVVLIKTYNDGTADKKSLYTYSTLDEAVASYHSALGGAIAAETIMSIMCMVINSVGGVHETSYWESSVSSFTVSFDGNGADAGEMEQQTFTNGTSQALSLNTFTKEGYNFLGWADTSDATEALYTDGETIYATKNMTLYAVWEAVE